MVQFERLTMPEQGYYGTDGTPWELWSDFWQFTPLTSDPSNTTEGDMWLRTDLDSGNRIASVRWVNADGVQDIPVFDATLTTGGLVKEVVRVQTPNGLGFLPVHEAGGFFPELAIQHSGTRHGFHNTLGVQPNSGILNWPHNEGSGSTVAESIGTYGDQNGAVNGATWVNNWSWWGGQYLDYDGTDDYTETGSWGSFFSTVAPSAFTLILEVAVPNGDDGYIIGQQDNVGAGGQLFGVGARSFLTQDQQGQLGIHMNESSGDGPDSRAGVRTDATFDDGNRHFVAFVLEDAGTTTAEVYVDTGFVASTFWDDGVDTSQFQDFGQNVHFGALGGAGGTISNYSSADVGRVLVCDTALSESELDSIAEAHGFSP